MQKYVPFPTENAQWNVHCKGSVITRTMLITSQNTVNLTQYDKGLYLYRISANGLLLKAGKIVKK
ncbi:MAG: hypothetical protein WCK78_13100 [Paludibacter sp.]